MKTAPKVTTAQHYFNTNNPMAGADDALFCVNSGVSASDAIDHLSLLLSGIGESLEALALEKSNANESSPLWCIFYSLTMAQSLAQSLHKAHAESARAESA